MEYRKGQKIIDVLLIGIVGCLVFGILSYIGISFIPEIKTYLPIGIGAVMFFYSKEIFSISRAKTIEDI